MQEIINYGSFLQAYALMNLIKEDDISFISIYSQTTDTHYIKHKKWIKEIKKLYRDRKKYLQTKLCRNKLKRVIVPFQKKYFHYKPGNFDLLIIGSDEVFNFAQKAPWDYRIFLGEGLSYSKICSFAASCGFTTIDMLSEESKQYIAKRIKEFEYLSVRDNGTYELIHTLSDKKIQYILDPVLLYNFKKEISNNIFVYPDDYMVVYSYNYRFSDADEIKEIQSFARKQKLKILAVEGVQTWINDYVAVTPFKLFSLFDKAKFIVTDTFHGTIIASKLHKRFVSFIRQDNSNKLEDLIKRLCLEEHKYSKGNLEKILLDMNDFTQYDSIISNERKKAEDYINCLKKGS